MKKLANTAKKIDIFAKIAFRVCIIGGGIMVAAALFVAFAGSSVLSGEAIHTVTLGSTTFEIAEPYAPEAGIVSLQMLIGTGIVAISAAVTCLGIRYIRNILEPMKNERPFDGTVHKNIKKLAWLTLIGGAAVELLSVVGTSIMMSAYDLAGIFSSEAINSINTELTVDGTFIIVFALLYLLSYVFQYGEELQTQSDETL